MLVNIHQIYFDEKSCNNCDPEWTAYDNSEKLTEYFENSVICELVDRGEHKKSDYFGVFSHDVKAHINFSEDGLRFNPKNLETIIERNQGIDFFAFEKRRKQKNIIQQAERYHKGFVRMFQTILEETKFLPEIPATLENIVLYNHFVARSDVFERYVTELLKPAMKVLESIPEAFNDARYKRIDEPTKERFIKAFGKPYWPFHPFVCERLPSLFLAKYNYSFKHIF